MVRLIINNKYGIIQNSKILAILSYIIGTVILILFYLLEDTFFMLLGVIYICIALWFNFSFLGILLIDYFKKIISKKEIITSILIISLNIPIVIGYYYLAMYILSSMD
ncbi:hypothetical protein LPB138_08035 [Urechidicola croceus]|uniref:Uncharacterized protein n=1 Tax=Urechidicola croceus TaxID=1850246 RepID=A0A1D8P7U3_9FLAO|nr:hypothetical protein LPB138_08035 [Urechidicola croceus]